MFKSGMINQDRFSGIKPESRYLCCVGRFTILPEFLRKNYSKILFYTSLKHELCAVLIDFSVTVPSENFYNIFWSFLVGFCCFGIY